MSHVTSYITEQNNLLVIVDGVRFYEFRDLTPRDVLWIDHKSQEDLETKYEDQIDTIRFALTAVKKLLVTYNSDIENEEWQTFIKINKEVQENIFINRIDWFDYLGFVFAAGNKTFNSYNILLDIPLTNIRDMNDVMKEFFEEQKRMMDEAEGRVR